MSVSPGTISQIANGTSGSATVTVTPTSAWSTAYGQQITVVATISNEANNPSANKGKNTTIVINGHPGSPIAGTLNLNPNNSQEQFTLTKPSGATITRSQLAADRSITYTGAATKIVFKPKGNGNNNTLTVNGQTLPVQNGTQVTIVAYNTTYSFSKCPPLQRPGHRDGPLVPRHQRGQPADHVPLREAAGGLSRPGPRRGHDGLSVASAWNPSVRASSGRGKRTN